jgi:predicted HNH restriction endonuclease
MICGYGHCPEALDFHHRDPKQKSFGLSVRGLTRSWEKIQKELDKCILVCANCHREIHAGITQPPKET